MTDSKVHTTITYRKPGTEPPIFVAGTFSDPQWEPQEMEVTTDNTGEHTFKKSMLVAPGSEVQYKFRVGLGDWWVLNEEAPTVIDDLGNRNNSLITPDQSSNQLGSKEETLNPTDQENGALEPNVLSAREDSDHERESSTPIQQVADTAAEVAESAEKIDAGKDPIQGHAPKSTLVDRTKDIQRERNSSTPIRLVAETAAEVADTARKLDEDKDFVYDGAPISRAVEEPQKRDSGRPSVTPTNEIAEIDAEVADTAEMIDANTNVAQASVPTLKVPIQAAEQDHGSGSASLAQKIAETAAEVASTAERLDVDKENAQSKKENESSYRDARKEEDNDFDEDGVILNTPLFAHENLGAYEFGDDDNDDDLDKGGESEAPPLFAHESLGAYDIDEYDNKQGRDDEKEHSGSVDYDVAKYDLNDPTLERWPSDRRSIIDAVRKVETCRNEDQTYFLGSPISPLLSSRRASIDSEVVESPILSSPILGKKLDVPRKRDSHGSMVSQRSHTSLASIAENEEEVREVLEEESEDDEHRHLNSHPTIKAPSPGVKQPTSDDGNSPVSDDDEGIVLMRSKPKTGTRTPQDVPSPTPIADTTGASTPKPQDAHSPVFSASERNNKIQLGESPSVRTGPPDEMDEIDDTEDEADAAIGPAAGRADTPPVGISTGQNEDSQPRRRNVGTDRALTPHPVHGDNDVARSNWLRAFFRFFFVDWIGGFFSRLWSGRK